MSKLFVGVGKVHYLNLNKEYKMFMVKMNMAGNIKNILEL